MTENMKVALFVSRKKDNKDVEFFKERRVSFLTTRDKDNQTLISEFEAFSNNGVTGEVSRFYISVNERDSENINKEFVKYLIDNPTFNPVKAPQQIASIASKSKNRAESKWLFDFDDENEKHLSKFVKDIKNFGQLKDNEVTVHETLNGFAVVVEHGFDTRELLKKWSDAELKRDDMLLVDFVKLI